MIKPLCLPPRLNPQCPDKVPGEYDDQNAGRFSGTSGGTGLKYATVCKRRHPLQLFWGRRQCFQVGTPNWVRCEAEIKWPQEPTSAENAYLEREAYVWLESANSAFIEFKHILANATLLVHPEHSATLNIMCDASDFAVGGVLQQYIDNVWQPLSFFSKNLAPAETHYSAFDRKLLAVYATIRHFRHNLEGRYFFREHRS